MLTWLIDTDGDWVLTIVRVVLGVVLFAHGAQKLLGWFGGQGFSVTVRTFRDQLGIPAPLACLAIAAEFFCGLGLIVGLLTRIAGSCDGNGSLEVRLFHELVWRKTRPWS